jgi:hypothetical protein
MIVALDKLDMLFFIARDYQTIPDRFHGVNPALNGLAAGWWTL